MKLRTLEPIVYDILLNDKQTRKDDYLLIERVIDKIIPTKELTFKNVMENHKELGLPSLESITRCRRKLQADNPDLVDNETQGYREEKIDDYIQYALDLGGDV